MPGRPGLTISIIARDEAKNLRELLPSVVPHADQVIVVDTGSTDETREVARASGGTVFRAPWEEDFAKARNFGLSKVETSHVLWLDADDRMDPAALARVRRMVLERPGVAFMLLLVNESKDPAGVTSCWQLRVFPSRPEHRFEGRVHEQIQTSLARTKTPVEKLDATVRHLGYLEPAEVVRKARRNLEMLRREIASGHAEDVNCLFHTVRAAFRCGELEEASAAARRCIDRPPPGTPREIVQSCAVVLARIERERGHPAEARAVLEDALRRVPDDAVARFFLGDLLASLGDLAGAARELSLARVSPIGHSTIPLPVAGLSRAIRLTLGQTLELLGRSAEAAHAYREVLELEPADRGARKGLVRALLAQGALAEAKAELETLGSLREDEGEVTLLSALLAFLQGESERSRELFRRARRLTPGSACAELHLGHLALRAGDHEEAGEHYKRALSLADTPETRVGLAAWELERGRVQECLAHLATAVEACPNRPLPPGTEALSGEAFFRAGRAEEAVSALERHLARFGADARTLSRLADCYRSLGAGKAAELGYREALRLSPGLSQALEGLELLGVGS
jgi:tetratricopeptide (TPR) repeat protein